LLHTTGRIKKFLGNLPDKLAGISDIPR
jgi:hypothetical protein